MSTRGATGFVADGKWYVTYNHSSSYPSWLGMRVLEFCKEITDWEKVKKNVCKVNLVDENSKPTPYQIRKYKKYANTRVSEQTLYDWYCLLRDLQGAGILREVADGNVSHMIDGHTFLKDSLFCEWAYIIDLDEMVLRVYKGFNKERDTNSTLPPDIAHDYFENSKGSLKDLEGNITKWDDNYYPVKELYAYSLSNLPEFMLGVTNEFKEQYRKEHNHNA